MTVRIKKALLSIAKVALSAALLYYLLQGGTLQRVIELTRDRFHLAPFLLGVAAFAISNVLGGLQWNILLRAQGIEIGLGRAIALYFVGLFFSNFLPANIGGDVVKVVDVYRSSGRGGGAVAATVMDRAIGLAMLAALACFAGPFALPVLGHQSFLLLLPLFLFLFVGAVLMMLSRRVGGLLLRITAAVPVRFVREKGESVLTAVLQFRGRRRALLLALGISLPVQTLRILVHFAAARAIGIDAPALYFFLFIPIVAVFIALPISINGIGVREGFGVLLFRKIGISTEAAISISFLAYVIGVLVSLAGGAIFVLRSREVRKRRALAPSLREEVESR
ncbi:MAG: lysylphosphatidylglycerol synthase transmembrane domain-containing protein [Candidatus Eisenbacteria bacterium]